jgi:hypothetical protein
MKKLLFLIVLIICNGLSNQALAQNSSCGTQFLDSGGTTGQYQNNENIITTLCPSATGEVVTVSFLSFNTETNFDFLKVYNGSGANASLIGTYTGTIIPAAITSTDVTGCLTFVFTSDSTVVSDGWIAAVTCGLPPTCLAPTNVVATASSTSPTSADLSWTENGTATQWEVTINFGTTITATSNPFIITGLTAGISNTITVRALCSPTDSSAYSNPINYTIPVPVTCPAPTNLTATASSSNTAVVSWIENGTATQWNVTISANGVTANTYTTTNNPYTITGLSPSTTYNVSVKAVCGANDISAISNTTSFTTPAAPPTPLTCGSQFIDNGGANAFYTNSADVTTTIYPTTAGQVVTVTFTSFDVEAGWDGLFVYNGNSITAPQIASTNPAATNSSGLAAGAFYGTAIPGPFTSSATDGSLTFRFKSDSSVNKAGWISNVTCGVPPTCPQPMSIAATAVTMTGASINWTEMGTATTWEVFVAPAGSPAPTAASSGVITTVKPYILTGLTIGTTYNVFVRSICSTSDFSAWTSVSFATVGCTAPVFSGSSSTNNSASVTWGTATTATQQYEVYMAGANAAAPTATTAGVPVTSNTYSVSGLSCGTSYSFYVRSICSPTLSSPWSLVRTVTTLTCTLTTGTPQSMSSCSDNGVNCFTLTNNDAAILNGLNPSLYTIVYYTNLAHTSVATAPYCLTNATATIYPALTKIATNEKQYFTFTVTSKSVNATQTLAVMSGCDDNFDGFVIFNLTTAPITTTNSLQYYTTLANATAQTSPITNPTAFSMAITAANTTIFIREIIAGACDNVYSMQLGAYTDCNLAYNCASANSLCGALGQPFANTHQGIQAEAGNAYGCLSSKPNPTWFYMHVSQSGTLNLKIEQNANITFPVSSTGQDVDYIVYGPFTNPTASCGALTAAQIVSCSFSAASIEYPVVANAQAGQYYLLMATNFSNQAGFIKISALPSSTGAIDCSGIRMNAFIDTNPNGVQDAGEVNFPLGQFHYTMNAGTMHNVVSPNGVYHIYDSNSTNLYDLSYTIDPNYTADYSISTASYTGVSVVSNGGSTTYNFPITITNQYNDLGVVVLPVNAPRAGTTYKNVVVYANLGNQLLPTGTVNFNKDAATTITTISQAGTTPTATGFSYNFTNLLPFEVRYITVTMQVPPLPTVAINQLLTNTANIVPPTGDVVASNNTSSLTQAIIAAYDPNDKTEAHGGKILYSSFNPNEYLTYTIRFENEGNASAIDVRVNDILDSRIDETSIKMVTASHAYTLDRVGSTLNWNFDNIQLPPSVANTDIGKGYITFQAKLRPGFALGTIIPNTASIYFDTNPAIVTNTFDTEFTAALATNSFEATNFVLYPNPASNLVYINLQNTSEVLESLEITDMLGKQIKTLNNIGATQASIDVSNFAKAIYFVIIKTESGLKQTKKLVVE